MSRLLPDSAERGRLIARHPEIFRVPVRQRALVALYLTAGAGLLIFGCLRLEFNFDRIWSGLRQLGWFVALMVPPSAGDSLSLYLHALAETLAIAFLGTVLAAIPAAFAGFLAARNVMPFAMLRFATRRTLDTIRGVDTLIWALIWINVVGLGPFAGVLAIATSDFGALGKLFSEAIEAADHRASEGIRAAGGSPLAEIRFGLLPEILPVIAGQILYFIESNTRSATIIGIVGAGGIGLHLAEQIRTLEWQHVSFIVILVLIAVAAIDFVSSRLRAAMTIAA